MLAGSDTLEGPEIDEEVQLQLTAAREREEELLWQLDELRRVDEVPAQQERDHMDYPCTPAWCEERDPECLEVSMCVCMAALGATLLILLHLGMEDPRYPTKR